MARGPGPTTKIWRDGVLVDWADATIHVLAHSVHYGSSVFEGVRCYEGPNGGNVFRLREHMRRLTDSAKIYRLAMKHSIDDLVNALERLNARLDAFEVATAARIEELGRELRGAVPAADPAVQTSSAVDAEPEDSAAQDAARVRAIDLALAGYSREAIANELAVSMTRGDVEALLDQVLVG